MADDLVAQNFMMNMLNSGGGNAMAGGQGGGGQIGILGGQSPSLEGQQQKIQPLLPFGKALSSLASAMNLTQAASLEGMFGGLSPTSTPFSGKIAGLVSRGKGG